MATHEATIAALRVKLDAQASGRARSDADSARALAALLESAQVRWTMGGEGWGALLVP